MRGAHPGDSVRRRWRPRSSRSSPRCACSSAAFPRQSDVWEVGVVACLRMLHRRQPRRAQAGQREADAGVLDRRAPGFLLTAVAADSAPRRPGPPSITSRSTRR
jgi:hypothetical protein